MEAQTMSTHAQCATLEGYSSDLLFGGPLFPLGSVSFEDKVWDSIPSLFLMRSLELHSCGIFGNLEEYEVENNYCNVSKFGKLRSGEKVYTGCIFSRWNPENYQVFMVMSHWDGHMVTWVSAARD